MPFRLYLFLSICAFTLLSNAQDIRFGFETGTLDGWKVMEGSFGMLICDRKVYHHNKKKYVHEGKWFLSTLESPQYTPNDRYTGVVVSPVFTLKGEKLNLLVGGGNHPSTYVALCTLDGREQARATGARTQTMQHREWNVPQLVGQDVYLKVVDQHQGGWGHVTLDDVRATGVLNPVAEKQRQTAMETARRLNTIKKNLQAITTDSLKQLLKDREQRFSSNEAQSLAKLDLLAKKITALDDNEGDLEYLAAQAETLGADFATLRRQIVLADPRLRGLRVLYVHRKQYSPDHHNTATLFQNGEINAGKFRGPGALRVLELDTGKVETILAAPTGIIRDPEVAGDGKRILFSMRRNKDDGYHIYETDVSGKNLRQLTFAEGISDIDPIYLPGGDIVFSSTREPKYCMCNRHIMCNLFRMGPDGTNIHQIGKSTLFEGHSSLLPDGRILYDRWEYVDRNFGDAQGLWTVNPDGTNHAVYWGNNTASPGAVLDARPLADGHRIIVTLSSCHDRPWGALAIIDRRLGIDGATPIVKTWPASAKTLAGKGNYDAFKRVRPRYEDPFPLADGLYLCSRTINASNAEKTGIFLIDRFGNELLLHQDDLGCFDPMPLRRRTLPPAIPARRNFAEKTGRFYVSNVYEGTHLQGLKPGTVKYLRIVESPEKRFWTYPSWGGQGVHCPAINWHSFETKRILGTVPVAADGSAYFRVPADRFVYFQLLDENRMMIQSMRSGTMIQSGETTGCVGCHEHRLEAPPPIAQPIPGATAQTASIPQRDGSPRMFSFRAEVQPILDRHCVKCHDFGKQAGAKLLLAGDRELTFNAAYVDLWRTKAIHCIGGGPAPSQPAYSWGSHASKLMQKIRAGHQNVKLSAAELERLATWIDLNGVYYPTYASAYPDNLAGRCPLNKEELKQLEKLTGLSFAKLASYNRKQRVKVSFDRPELSPCLAGLKPEAREEALAIIRTGTRRLEEKPRGDMPNFVACPVDQRREKKYSERKAQEARMRRALQTGESLTERKPPSPQNQASE